MNSIRPDALASLRVKGEAWNRKPTRGGQGNSGGLRCGETVSAATGMHGVVGDRMAGSWSDVNQGSRSGNSDGVHGQQSRSEEPSPEGDRAFVRAKKRGNARRAKGGRVVEADQPKLGSTKRGVVPRQVAVRASMRYLPSYGGICLPLDAKKESGSRAVGRRSHPEVRWTLARAESGHHLESRMREIRLSGLGGGVASSIVTPTSSQRNRRCARAEFSLASWSAAVFRRSWIVWSLPRDINPTAPEAKLVHWETLQLCWRTPEV
jgi:hypothetical protein